MCGSAIHMLKATTSIPSSLYQMDEMQRREHAIKESPKLNLALSHPWFVPPPIEQDVTTVNRRVAIMIADKKKPDKAKP